MSGKITDVLALLPSSVFKNLRSSVRNLQSYANYLRVPRCVCARLTVTCIGHPHVDVYLSEANLP